MLTLPDAIRRGGLFRVLVAFGSLAAAGCGGDSGSNLPPTPAPALSYTWEISVNNLDPVLYEVWIVWTDSQGQVQSVLLDVLDANQVGTWFYDVIPGQDHRLVLADMNGTGLDTADMGSIIQPATSPYLFGRLVVGGVFLPR